MNLASLRKEIAALKGHLASNKLTAEQEEIRKLLETEYSLWLTKLLGRHFRAAPEDQFAQHHHAFWQWGWEEKPNPSSALLVWNRGGAKSTSAEAFAVERGARGQGKYALYVCRTQAQADGHVNSINSMLLSSEVGTYYPNMSRPRIQHIGTRQKVDAWNRQTVTTAEGWTVQGYGLLSSMRGIRVEEYRPDLIIISDIDDVNDSIGMVESLESALAGSVLGTMGNDCIVLFEQNLIHRNSVANRILTRKSDILSERVTFGPIPAVYNAEYERKQNRWFMAGIASWPGGMPLAECESKLNKVGRDEWDREYQHDIEKPYEDAIYPMWDERYHVITWSEFAAGFVRLGCPPEWLYEQKDYRYAPRLPDRGKIVMAQDWGNTYKHPCGNRWAWAAPEEMGLINHVFYYREMVWPRFPKVELDDRRHPSALQLGEAIHKIEKDWSESARVSWRLASHERPEIVEAYFTDMRKAGMKPLLFGQVDTSQAREGILHMQNFLRIEPDQRHPFRIYPDGHPQAGQPLQGSPRLFFVVADGQGELYMENGELKVRPAIDEAGMARTRFEYPNYHKPDTAAGTETTAPPKRDDDMCDVDRAIAGMLFPSMDRMTDEQKLIRALPYKNIQALPPEQKQGAEMANYFAYHTMKHRQEQQEAQQSKGVYQDVWEKYNNPNRYARPRLRR